MVSYEDLIKANKEYRLKYYRYEKSYYKAQIIDWNNLYQAPDNVIRNKVLKYLNEFGCRIKINQDIIDSLKEAHLQSIPYLDALRNESLWDIDFSKEIFIYQRKTNFTDTLATIFENYDKIGNRFRHVATSKLLHQINPSLFMMWDNAIIAGYSLSKNGQSYVQEYLPKMKAALNELIESYMEETGSDRSESIVSLNSIQRSKTMLKILDEYNWISTRP